MDAQGRKTEPAANLEYRIAGLEARLAAENWASWACASRCTGRP